MIKIEFQVTGATITDLVQEAKKTLTNLNGGDTDMSMVTFEVSPLSITAKGEVFIWQATVTGSWDILDYEEA